MSRRFIREIVFHARTHRLGLIWLIAICVALLEFLLAKQVDRLMSIDIQEHFDAFGTVSVFLIWICIVLTIVKYLSSYMSGITTKHIEKYYLDRLIVTFEKWSLRTIEKEDAGGWRQFLIRM